MTPMSNPFAAGERFRQVLPPIQQFGSMFLDNMERVADYQFELMQSYTHMTMEQWRDALAIRDAETMGDYLRKQSERAREFSEKVSKDSRRLMELNQETSRQALRAAEQSARAMTQFADLGVTEFRRSAEQAVNRAQKAAERAEAEAQQASNPVIADYDSLTATDIEQRAAKMSKEQIRQLLQHERSNKNRKTLIDSLERHI